MECLEIVSRQVDPDLDCLWMAVYKLRLAIMNLKEAHIKFISHAKLSPEEESEAKLKYRQAKIDAERFLYSAEEKLVGKVVLPIPKPYVPCIGRKLSVLYEDEEYDLDEVEKA